MAHYIPEKKEEGCPAPNDESIRLPHFVRPACLPAAVGTWLPLFPLTGHQFHQLRHTFLPKTPTPASSIQKLDDQCFVPPNPNNAILGSVFPRRILVSASSTCLCPPKQTSFRLSPASVSLATFDPTYPAHLCLASPRPNPALSIETRV